MHSHFGFRVAVFGLALAALALVGSTQATANVSIRDTSSVIQTEIRKNYAAGKRLYASGNYLESRRAFRTAAALAERSGSQRLAAQSLINAGASSLARQDMRRALPDFLKALDIARIQQDFDIEPVALGDLALIYISSGHPDAAAQAITGALARSIAFHDPRVRPGLKVQLALALAAMKHPEQAVPICRDAVDELLDHGDLETAVKALATLGNIATDAHRLDIAEQSLDQAFWISRIHHLPDYASVVRGLAKVREMEGNRPSAAVLFDAALRTPRSVATRWMVYADRGDFRLSGGDTRGALADFEEARRLIELMRSDVVPADADRVASENRSFSRVSAGLVEAGNRLHQGTGDRKYIDETFEAAEQGRMWSLRELVPSGHDWRSRLPENYWDILAQYQSAEQMFIEKPSAPVRARATELGFQLQHLEATAQSAEPEAGAEPGSSALAEAQRVLDSDTVLFSFLLTPRGGWLWALDREHAAIFPLPTATDLKPRIDSFVRALRAGSRDMDPLGREIFEQLFGSVPLSMRAHSKWLLELDGPLYDLPFAALPAGSDLNGPVYLAQRAVLQAIPGVLLSRPADRNQAWARAGGLLAIGDAVYNAADDRFPRAVASHLDSRRIAALPRLPATAEEVRQCSRAWGTQNARILTGRDASLAGVEAAVQSSHPSVIHFATHVIPGPDQFSSGLIALSLNPSGAMGLLGPAEIQARPVTAALVVLDGCHSDQGETLPASGMMGLTRAWIGSGAGAVLATRWEIPDDASQNLMADFYRNLHADWDKGPAWALQQAEMHSLRKGDARGNAALLGSWFLLGRI